MLSYAQLFEDVFLQRCFGTKDKGFYIDIGASHPVYCNSTYHFYQRGWSGIAIEPTPFRLQELRRARPRDINLGVAVGRSDGRGTFNIAANADHLSSLYERPSDLINGHSARVQAIDVEVVSLSTLCRRHAPSSIDFIKIDVEGAEGDVIAGADWDVWRPAVLVIEATEPGNPKPAWFGWEPMLLAAGYDFAFFDGVNRYYIAKERADLAEHFKIPINPFDGAVALHSFGFANDDRRHPDYAWARNFAERVLASAAIETDEGLLRLMTWDLLDTELASATTRESIHLAFQRVLARGPGEPDISHWEARSDLTLRHLFAELLAGEEFRLRRSRASTRSMWR